MADRQTSRLNFKHNPFKLIDALTLLLEKKNPNEMFRLIKTVYYADKYHLLNYGRPIFGGTYYAMEFGPVNSELYNFLKSDKEYLDFLKGVGINQSTIKKIGAKDIHLIENKPITKLSESDKLALNWAFEKVDKLYNKQIIENTHDEIYKDRWKNREHGKRGNMYFEDLLETQIIDFKDVPHSKLSKELVSFIKDH